MKCLRLTRWTLHKEQKHVGHEHQASQVRPLVDHLLDAAHHPRGETPTLKIGQDEDVGQVREADIVGDEARKASKF